MEEISIGKRLELLANPIWSNKDIMDFVGVKEAQASKIHQEAVKKHNGQVPYNFKKVKRDAVLAVIGINLEQEQKNLQEISKTYNTLFGGEVNYAKV